MHRACVHVYDWPSTANVRGSDTHHILLPYLPVFSQQLRNVSNTHMFKRQCNVSQGEQRKKIWGSRDNAEGESSRLCVCLSMCAWAREEEVSMREIRESLKWDDKDRKAQIDIAITKKTILQLGIHLHTLGVRWLTSHWLHSISLINGVHQRVITGQSLCTSEQSTGCL